ncbi:hypothetical protein [Cohnella soli]|uniref:Uncharacterized protein n=1 Tax=Cohnella soli TaxID=425005 RepID=A0ABW0I2Z5_9BACL
MDIIAVDIIAVDIIAAVTVAGTAAVITAVGIIAVENHAVNPEASRARAAKAEKAERAERAAKVKRAVKAVRVAKAAKAEEAGAQEPVAVRGARARPDARVVQGAARNNDLHFCTYRRLIQGSEASGWSLLFCSVRSQSPFPRMPGRHTLMKTNDAVRGKAGTEWLFRSGH